LVLPQSLVINANQVVGSHTDFPVLVSVTDTALVPMLRPTVTISSYRQRRQEALSRDRVFRHYHRRPGRLGKIPGPLERRRCSVLDVLWQRRHSEPGKAYGGLGQPIRCGLSFGDQVSSTSDSTAYANDGTCDPKWDDKAEDMINMDEWSGDTLGIWSADYSTPAGQYLTQAGNSAEQTRKAQAM